MPGDREQRAIRSERRRQRRQSRLRAGDGPKSGPARRLREAARAAILRIGKDSRPFFDGILARSSKIGDPGFPDPGFFPWVEELEAKSEVIRKELERLLQDADMLPELRRISPDHDRIASARWKAFFLYGYGHRVELGCRLCPETANALDGIPDLESAFFSILLPGMHIRKHRGPTKSLLVGHLGVKVPKEREKCVIRVDDEIRSWEEGKVLMSDDTHEHEVWNDTDEIRVVLLLHVRRPLRFPGSLVGSFIFNAIRSSPFVRDGRKNLADWERQFQLRDPERAGSTPINRGNASAG